jgi:hypothetical protein
VKKKAVAWSMRLFLIVTLLLAIVPVVAGQSSSEEARPFPTGFVVRGEFLHFFERYGDVETFGYPLTIEFEEAGRVVQYFHRGRMELQYPENPPGQRVALGPLGELLTAPEPPVAAPEPGVNGRFFPETGHTVSAAFLSYFEGRGGVDFFGYPITEMMVENRRVVQYFQRARLEWHPDNPSGLRVRPGRLGEIYLDQFPPPSWALDPASDENYGLQLPNVTALDVVASVDHPSAAQDQPQTLFVFVYDQDGAPVEGVKVRAVIHFPNGDGQVTLPPTNDLGLSWLTFNVGQVPMGETVAIEVLASYAGVEGATQTSFLVWL